MTDILAVARKDLRLLLRDRSGFFFTFFWPVIMAMFFGSIFGGGGTSGDNAIPLLVVDEDRTEASQLLVSSLEGADEVRIVEATLAEATAQVRRGAVPAYLQIARGFGEAADNRFMVGAPTVQLVTDPSRAAEAGMLEGILQREGASLLQSSFTNPTQVDRMVGENLESLQSGPQFEGRGALEGFLGSLKALTDSGLLAASTTGGAGNGSVAGSALVPLQVVRSEIAVDQAPPRPNNPYAVSFAQAMLWAFLGCAASFGISLAVERSQGTLVRLRMSPLDAKQILGGKGLACFATSFAMSLFLITLAVVVFGVRPLSWPLLLLALICTAVCFVGIMMLLSVLGRSERAAAGIGWAILLVMSMFGGGMVPLFIMPPWMKAVSDFSPVKWGIYAIEGAVWRGFSPSEMILPCVVLLSVGLVCFSLGARLFRWGELG